MYSLCYTCSAESGFQGDIFSIRRRGLFLSNWIIQGEPSQIKSIEAIPQEAIIIEYGDNFYKFGQQLTDSERDWLVQEIQAWLDE